MSEQYLENSPWLTYFLEICKIPHGSGHTEAIADYLVSFAKTQRLTYTRDASNNVFIVRGASDGRENEPAMLLQGHTDMVCEKVADSTHDFLTDPIRTVIRDGRLYADGTTLGGDDGVAVAIMLALLSDRTLSAPRLECLFTSDEETGLYGAKAFDCTQITARRMINLDSEEEGVATIGCAGGAVSTLTMTNEVLPPVGKPIHIRLFGLAGGHSGAEIHRGRANAIILMARLLDRLYSFAPFRLAALHGGQQNNAIPRACEAILFVQDMPASIGVLQAYGTELEQELSAEDKGFRLHISRAKGTFDCALTYRDTSRAISAILLSQNGVLAMCADMPDQVETSTNVGVVSVTSERTEIISCDRSCVASKLADVLTRHRRLAHVLEANLEVTGEYPAWKPIYGSPLQESYLRAAKEIYGVDGKVCAIHAGLECGILSDACPGMDAISIGPDLQNIHTPEESLSLASFDRLYALVKRMLA